jgi:hypothetical protein
VLRLYSKARRGFLSTVLRMSPAGVEWWDGYGFHVRLRWDRIVLVGEVQTAMTKPGARVGVSGGVRLTVRALEVTPYWLAQRVGLVAGPELSVAKANDATLPSPTTCARTRWSPSAAWSSTSGRSASSFPTSTRALATPPSRRSGVAPRDG